MVKTFGVKDGAQNGTPNSYDLPKGRLLKCLQEKGLVVKFLGEEFPVFHSNAPSIYNEHIVVNIPPEDVINPQFPSVGYYLIENLHPRDADRLFLNDANQETSHLEEQEK